MSKKSVNFIKNSVQVDQPIIQIISYEEKRVETHLKNLFQQLKRDQSFYFWDINNGLVKDNQFIKDSREPINAMNHLMKESPTGFCVFRDLNSAF